MTEERESGGERARARERERERKGGRTGGDKGKKRKTTAAAGLPRAGHSENKRTTRDELVRSYVHADRGKRNEPARPTTTRLGATSRPPNASRARSGVFRIHFRRATPNDGCRSRVIGTKRGSERACDLFSILPSIKEGSDRLCNTDSIIRYSIRARKGLDERSAVPI